MQQIIPAISIIVIITFVMMIRVSNDNKRNEILLYNYLVNRNSELFRLISDTIKSSNFNNQLENLLSYEIFKESCLEYILSEVEDYIDENGYDCLFSNRVVNPSILKNIDINSAVIDILNSNEIDNMIAHIYVDRVTENIKEAEQNEKDAIAYHKSFGSEPSGDPVLHQKEKEIDTVDVINEYGLNELMGIGTAEDLPE